MKSVITSVIASADAQGRYLNPGELDRIKSFISTAERSLRVAQILADNRKHIVSQAAVLLFNKQTALINPGGNAYGEKMTTTCLRDLDYYLRLVSYGLVAGSVAPIEEFGLLTGIPEIYRSLGTPLYAVAEGVLAMEVVASSILSDEDAHEAHTYFDYIINFFDDVIHNSKQVIKDLYKQQRDNSTNLQIQNKLQELLDNFNKATSEELDRDIESWEPKTYLEWRKLDRLAQQLQRKGVDNQEGFESSAIAFFESWRCMPMPLRKAVWREREVMAALCEHIDDWSKIPGFSHIGVAKKPFGEHEELVGLITLKVFSDDYFYDQFNIPRHIEVDSLISDFSNQERVRLLLECVLPSVEYSNSLASQKSLLSDVLTTTPLQSGDLIVGSNKNGHLNEAKVVTLTTFVVPQDSSEKIVEPQVMSVMHGFTAGYTEISTCALQPCAKFGQVFYKSANQQEQAEKLDVALIKIDGCLELVPFLKWVEATPGKPFPAWSGMLVQMYGGVSGHTTGYVNHSMVVFPGASSSVIPEFTAIIPSQPGDSGSLLVAGNGSGDPILDAEVKGLHPSQIENLRFAMVGMLVGGAPSGGSYTNLTYFRPIVDICQQLRVKPYLEKHSLIGEPEKETPISRTIQSATE